MSEELTWNIIHVNCNKGEYEKREKIQEEITRFTTLQSRLEYHGRNTGDVFHFWDYTATQIFVINKKSQAAKNIAK